MNTKKSIVLKIVLMVFIFTALSSYLVLMTSAKYVVTNKVYDDLIYENKNDWFFLNEGKMVANSLSFAIYNQINDYSSVTVKVIEPTTVTGTFTLTLPDTGSGSTRDMNISVSEIESLLSSFILTEIKKSRSSYLFLKMEITDNVDASNLIFSIVIA